MTITHSYLPTTYLAETNTNSICDYQQPFFSFFLLMSDSPQNVEDANFYGFNFVWIVLGYCEYCGLEFLTKKEKDQVVPRVVLVNQCYAIYAGLIVTRKLFLAWGHPPLDCCRVLSLYASCLSPYNLLRERGNTLLPPTALPISPRVRVYTVLVYDEYPYEYTNNNYHTTQPPP